MMDLIEKISDWSNVQSTLKFIIINEKKFTLKLKSFSVQAIWDNFFGFFKKWFSQLFVRNKFENFESPDKKESLKLPNSLRK